MSTSLRIVDTDLHHGMEESEDLVPYLDDGYVERYLADGIPGGMGFGNTHLRRRDDLGERNYSTTSTPADAQEFLLDEYDIEAAILTGNPVASASATPDTGYANALCRAFNDYSIEEWLPADGRFRLTISVNPDDPGEAAEEIRRVGDDPDVVGAMLPTSATRPYGHKRYDPIHEACEELGLTVTHHLGGGGGGTNPYPPTGAGWPSYYVENRLTRHAKYLAHFVSYVFEGTFEKFPDLRVAFLESGWAWVPPLLWRMDAEHKGFRAEVPWLTKSPSEYYEEHVWFNTQPVEEPENLDQLDAIIDWMSGEEKLMFATDFPHQDFDNPDRTLIHLDPEVRQRIFADNAVEAFDLDL